MCISGEGGCIANSLFCDANEDCDDGSDEINCGLYIYLNVPVTLGVAALSMALLFVFNEAIKLYLRKRTVLGPRPIPIPPTPVVLRLPYLEDMVSNFPKIFSDTVFETILFNENTVYFIQFLEIIRLQNLSPQQRHQFVQSLLYHMKTNYEFPDNDTVFNLPTR